MLQRFPVNFGYSVFVALSWVGLWHLNNFLFDAAEVAPLVSLIFLPAILRPWLYFFSDSLAPLA